MGVDSSTQSCKAVVWDPDSHEVIAEGRAGHPDGTEVDPRAWWVALLDAISAAGGLEGVDAVSVAGQQHGMVLLDEHGEIIRPALLWNDTRSAGAARALIAEFGASELARRTGSVPVASFTATKLRWVRDAEPENARRVAAVALPHDWLTWRLRGYGPRGEAPLGPQLDELTTDRSDASGTSYWSPATGEYDRELLRAALGHDAILPRVLDPAGAAGQTAAQGPIPEGLLVAAGAGDNAAAALGLGAGPADAVISIGTSGTVFAVTDDVRPDPTGAVAGFADATGRRLPLVATMNAARILDKMSALLGVDHGGLGELALQAPAGAGGLVLQPYFEGERTPNLPDATATLFGMTLKNSTRECLARAAIEGMLCGLAEGLDSLVASGGRVERILLIGGAAQNAAVSTIAAEIFDVPISVPEPAQYVALGAAAQAAWALTGSQPRSAVHGSSAVASRHPEIREAYSARRAS